MQLLGPGRAFLRVRLVEKDESAARFHSHSHVDEYYLILSGKGTLRYNGSETEVKAGDLVGKPAGPEIAMQLIADRGERLRLLDMEVARPGSSLQGHHSQPRLQGTPTERVRVGSHRSRRVPDYARGFLPPLRPGIREDEGWRVGPVPEPRP